MFRRRRGSSRLCRRDLLQVRRDRLAGQAEAGGGVGGVGGGVEVGETFGDALRRELMEEGRIEMLGEPVLHGVFLNSHVSRRDHVAVYLIRNFSQDRLPEANHEIIACGFFDANALPAETTQGTRLRIAEVLESRSPISSPPARRFARR